MNYKHRQIGYLIIAIFAIVEAWLIYKILSPAGTIWLELVSAVIIISCALFCSLTVEIKESFLDITFGIGLIKKKFKIEDIMSANAVKNKWYYGWGIRLIRNGWLYNVSGLDAVEIKMKNGKIYRIGTDEPEKLLEAIRAC